MQFTLAILPASGGLIAFVNAILQLVTLPSTYWGTYEGRTEYGTLYEIGHFGVWSVCSGRPPYFVDNCDHYDTFFQLSNNSTAAGVLACCHLLLLLVFLPFAVIRTVQVIRGVTDGCIHPKVMCLTKITVAVVALALAVLILILSSLGYREHIFYEIDKGWSFWLQLFILVLDIFLVLICSLENIQYWRLLNMEDASNAPDDFSETYSNPHFDSGSPTANRRSAGSEVSVTRASGEPYYLGPQGSVKNHKNGSAPSGTILSSGRKTVIAVNDDDDDELTYQNPVFEEKSPRSKRSSSSLHQYNNHSRH